MESPLSPFLEIRPEGLHAAAFEAFVDPPRPVVRAILSHAHADHAVAGHEEIWATPETIALYRRRHPEWSGRARAIRCAETIEAQGTAMTLFPAGHILGSAQLHFERDGRSLLYTGDFKRRASRSTPPAQAPHADVLVCETTFGLPVFHFPGKEEIEDRLVAACRAAIQEGKTPVVLAYALGKSQEAAAILADQGIPTVLHGAAWKLVPDYAAAGIPLPLSRAYATGLPEPGEVFIVPPNCARTPVVRKIRRRCVIYLSGWASRPASRADFDADVLLPMSDHADFPDLLRHVTEVAPQAVATMHGYAGDFARILVQRGVSAAPLTEDGERRLTDEAPAETVEEDA